MWWRSLTIKWRGEGGYLAWLPPYIMDKLPTRTIDLLKELERMFPDQMVTEQMSDFERGKKAGVIELLRLLQQTRNTGE